MSRAGQSRAGTTRLGTTASAGGVFDVAVALDARLDRPATRQNVALVAEDYAALQFDVDLSAAGAPDDLTGATAEWAAAVTRGGETVLDGGQTDVTVTVDEAAATVTVAIATDATATLGGGRYHHELDVISAAGRKRTAAVGWLRVDYSTT